MNFIAWLVMDKMNQNEISYLEANAIICSKISETFPAFIPIKDEILPFLNYYLNALKAHVIVSILTRNND